MTLREWLRNNTPRERGRAARRVGTSVAYFYQLAGGHNQPSFKMALAIERATNYQVMVDDWLPFSGRRNRVRKERARATAL